MPPRAPQVREVIPAGGRVVTCTRCSAKVVVADIRNADADPRAIRLAKDPAVGHCVDCAVCSWFCAMELRTDVHDPASLLLPHVQAAFLQVMKGTRSDLSGSEINWAKVVACWDLPFDIGGRLVAPDKALAAAQRLLKKERRGRRPR